MRSRVDALPAGPPRGGQGRFSNLAIETTLILGAVLRRHCHVDGMDEVQMIFDLMREVTISVRTTTVKMVARTRPA
jgi:hypothetical protein